MRNVVGAPIPESLAREALQTAEKLRTGKASARDAEQAVEVICRMTDEVLNYFFVRPIERLGMGGTVQRMTRWGIHNATKMIRIGLARVLPKLKPEQLREVANFLDGSLHEGSDLR